MSEERGDGEGSGSQALSLLSDTLRLRGTSGRGKLTGSRNARGQARGTRPALHAALHEGSSHCV